MVLRVSGLRTPKPVQGGDAAAAIKLQRHGDVLSSTRGGRGSN